MLVLSTVTIFLFGNKMQTLTERLQKGRLGDSNQFVIERPCENKNVLEVPTSAGRRRSQPGGLGFEFRTTVGQVSGRTFRQVGEFVSGRCFVVSSLLERRRRRSEKLLFWSFFFN